MPEQGSQARGILRRVRGSLLSCASCAALLVAGCPSHGDSEPEGALVVGIAAQSDFGPLIGSVHAVVRVDGAVVSDQTALVGANAPPGGLPKEIPLTGRVGAKVDVEVSALAPSAAPGAAPVISRLAGAHLVAGGKKLLRVTLEPACVSLPGVSVTCAAPLTCIGGQCASGEVADGDLEDYDPGWAAAAPDICRPAKHGAPEVVVGTGQTDYAPLADGQTLSMELGPQGGHHIWIAVRMRNLRQSGSTTLITARVPDDPSLVVQPFAVVFTFDRDEGNYCKLWGLRFQLDSGAADLANAYKPFLGKQLEVTVTVTDSLKESATATRTIQLGPKLICPDGTDSCNQ